MIYELSLSCLSWFSYLWLLFRCILICNVHSIFYLYLYAKYLFSTNSGFVVFFGAVFVVFIYSMVMSMKAPFGKRQKEKMRDLSFYLHQTPKVTAFNRSFVLFCFINHRCFCSLTSVSLLFILMLLLALYPRFVRASSNIACVWSHTLTISQR